MRRAVMFATLALLLLAVAGVTAAQEGVFENTEPDGDVTETTVPETTGFERTIPEETTPEETALEQTTPEDEDVTEGPAEDDAERLKDGGEGRRDPGGGADDDSEGDASRGQGKVVVCHKDKKTLTVGASAEPAHLRHGDTSGACGSPEDTPGNGKGRGFEEKGGGPPQGNPGRGGR